EVALDPRVTGLMLAHGSVLRTFVAIDKQAPLFLAADGIVVFRFEQHPGFDPFPDHLAALRLGFGWAVLLHHEPSRPVFGLRRARIASTRRHLSLCCVENGIEGVRADVGPRLWWRPPFEGR